jgi:ABC-type taurine transport system substrate-binding protein
MLRRVALVGTKVSKERITSIIRVTRIGELGTTLAVTSNRRTLPILATLMVEALCSSEILVLIRSARRNIPEDGILHSHRRENLKSYIALTGWTL